MPGVTIIIPGFDPKSVLRLKRVIEKPEPILKQIGIVLLADAQRSFKEQRLGSMKWAPRYPGQSPPPMNIAGIVADFLAGRKTPPDRRFQNRPAGIDTSQTLRSLTASKAMTVQGYVVKVVSATPGAGNMQHGGVSRQPITGQVKTLLAAWMNRLRNAAKRARATSPKPSAVQPSKFRQNAKQLINWWNNKKAPKPKYKMPAVIKEEASKKLGFLFQLSVLKTTINQRPFFGITDEGEQKIIAIVSGSFLGPGTKGKKT